MARYDKDFKLKCIKALDDHKPLLKVEGVKYICILKYAILWRINYHELGVKGIEDCYFQNRFTVKDKMKAMKMAMSEYKDFDYFKSVVKEYIWYYNNEWIKQKTG